MYKCVATSANSVDFTLTWRRSFANPLFAVEYLDLTNDGLKEIAVASLAGLHVLQHNVDRREKELVSEMNQTTGEYVKEMTPVT